MIKKRIKKCLQCSRDKVPNKEPLMPTSLSQHPWQKVCSDLFVRNGTTYLLVVDYFSRHPKVIQLKTPTSQSIIHDLKSIFSRHGKPHILLSDNGPQYSSQEFTAFADLYGFTHTTSSPHYLQSNGLAERTVKTVKGLLKEAADPHLALVTYRATSLLWCTLSPAELLMGRKLHTDIPTTTKSLMPQWKFLEIFREKDSKSFDYPSLIIR